MAHLMGHVQMHILHNTVAVYYTNYIRKNHTIVLAVFACLSTKINGKGIYNLHNQLTNDQVQHNSAEKNHLC